MHSNFKNELDSIIYKHNKDIEKNTGYTEGFNKGYELGYRQAAQDILEMTNNIFKRTEPKE